MSESLTVSGMLSISSDMETLNKVYEIVRRHEAHVLLVPVEGEGLCMKVEHVYPGEEHRFLEFLADIGKAAPGKIVGEFQVWWPGARESGPQWWELNEMGGVTITEGEVVRGASHAYTGE